MSLSTYDRLVAFGRKQLNGKWVFDLDKIPGELAESYDVSPDGLKMTSAAQGCEIPGRLAVTAEDVKWSLDRCVTAQILGKAQLLTGSLTRPTSSRYRSPHHRSDAAETRQTGAAQSRHGLPNHHQLETAKAHATEEDPWATAWLKEHTAGIGAYIVETFKPGEQVILKRNEAGTGLARQAGLFQARDHPVRA